MEADEAEPAPLPAGVYHPDNALVAAIRDWIPEFSKQKTVSAENDGIHNEIYVLMEIFLLQVWGPMSKPQVGLTVPTLIPTVNTCEKKSFIIEKFLNILITEHSDDFLGMIATGTNLAVPQGNPAEIQGQQQQVPQQQEATPIPTPQPAAVPVTGAAAPEMQKSLLPGAAVTVAAINGLIQLPPRRPSTADADVAEVDEEEGGMPSQDAPAADQAVTGGAVATPSEGPSTPLAGACPSSILQPISLPLMNSLVSTNKVVVDHGLLSATAAPIGGPAAEGAPAAKSVVDGGDVAAVTPPLPGAIKAVAEPAMVAAVAAAATTALPPLAPVVPADQAPAISAVTQVAPAVAAGIPGAPAAAGPGPAVRPSATTVAAATVALAGATDDDAPMAPVVAAAAATQIAAGLTGVNNPTLLPPPPAPPIVPVPHDVIPGPTYHEPMEIQVSFFCIHLGNGKKSFHN